VYACRYTIYTEHMMYVRDVEHICSDIRVAIYMSHYIYTYESLYICT